MLNSPDQVLRISDDSVTVPCTMFVLCENDAQVMVPHPVLDWVPSCERCATKLGYVISDDMPLAVLEPEQ